MTQKTKACSADLSHGRRDLLRTAAFALTTGASWADGGTLAAPGASTAGSKGIRAFKLYTGPDNASHVLEGTVNQSGRADVIAIHFKETPAHSSAEWHNTPEPQYVITLSGTLEFTLRDGAKFVLRPGDVLLSEDHTGTGHRWRLIDDQPWRRAYVVMKTGAHDSFVAMAGEDRIIDRG